MFGKIEKEKYIFGYNCKEGPVDSAVQYGGTRISVIGNATHRIINRETDSSGLGKWSWVQMQRKNGISI